MSDTRNSDMSSTGSPAVAGQAAPGPLVAPHAATGDAILAALQSSHHGLDGSDAAARLERYGHNTLPRAKPPGIVTVFLHQFTSPLVYVLVVAALLSLAI